MSDRPSHAATIHPYVVEFPLWTVWRTAAAVHFVQDFLGILTAAYRDMEPLRRLRALATVSTVLTAVLAVVTILLLVN